MQQRYRRGMRVTLISLGATVTIPGLQLAFIHLPPLVALV